MVLVDLVEEENLTREHKNSNLIVIGYLKKQSNKGYVKACQ